MNNKALFYDDIKDEELVEKGFTRIERENIVSLSKRARWLKERSSENPNLTYDRAELRALIWAINLILKG